MSLLGNILGFFSLLTGGAYSSKDFRKFTSAPKPKGENERGSKAREGSQGVAKGGQRSEHGSQSGAERAEGSNIKRATNALTAATLPGANGANGRLCPRHTHKQLTRNTMCFRHTTDAQQMCLWPQFSLPGSILPGSESRGQRAAYRG